ncbi:hypothetical protein FRC06_002698 [Ceratobasidium sp. 370]|nr:hypothetical protein FRC06_002698 [Ceratobasidium sp. 370]
MWTIFRTVGFNRRNQSLHEGSISTSDSESASETDSNPEDSGMEASSDTSDEKAHGRRGKRQDPKLATTSTILMMLRFRNKAVNFFQTLVGVFGFACNTHKTVFRAHRTASDPAFQPQRYFMLVYDNINKYHVPRTASVAKKTHMANGTAATAIVLEGVPAGAFNPRPYEANVARQERQTLTVGHLLGDIQQEHMRRVGGGMILRIVLAHIPSLRHLSKTLEQRFCTPAPAGYAKHRLTVRKTEILPMSTSGINEATTKGNSDVIHDLVATQMKMKPEWFDDMLIMVCGDQMTTDRLRKAIRYRSKDVNAFEQRRWVLPIAQLFHMKHAFLGVIFDVHWSSVVAEGVYGLRHAVEALGRKINASECDFYPCHEALKVVFDTFILVLFLNHIREAYGAQLDDDTRTKFSGRSHMLQELGAYFDDGGPLHHVDLDMLEDIANNIYDSYLTTSAYESAISCEEDSSPTQSRITSLMAEVVSQLQNANLTSPVDKMSSSESNGSSEDEKPRHAKATKAFVLGSVPCIGDQGLAVTIALLRDSFWYLEMATSIAEGDIGRVMEVVKILRVAFWGGGATNYGNELLEMACSHLYKYPPDLLTAVWNNYLINPSGLPGHFQEVDLLQEHHNLAIKTVFNPKNSEFGSSFTKGSVSINIVGLAGLRDSLLQLLGLNRTARGKTQSEYEADINVLAQHYQGGDSILVRQPTRQHRFLPRDIFGGGIEHLQTKSLANFLKCTALDAPESDPIDNETEASAVGTGTGPADMDNQAPYVFDNGPGYLSLPGAGFLK